MCAKRENARGSRVRPCGDTTAPPTHKCHSACGFKPIRDQKYCNDVSCYCHRLLSISIGSMWQSSLYTLLRVGIVISSFPCRPRPSTNRCAMTDSSMMTAAAVAFMSSNVRPSHQYTYCEPLLSYSSSAVPIAPLPALHCLCMTMSARWS